jgi:hypothetical protein
MKQNVTKFMGQEIVQKLSARILDGSSRDDVSPLRSRVSLKGRF